MVVALSWSIRLAIHRSWLWVLAGHHCTVAICKLLNLCASVTKQYNLVPVEGYWQSEAGMVTVDLAMHMRLRLSGLPTHEHEVLQNRHEQSTQSHYFGRYSAVAEKYIYHTRNTIWVSCTWVYLCPCQYLCCTVSSKIDSVKVTTSEHELFEPLLFVLWWFSSPGRLLITLWLCNAWCLLSLAVDVWCWRVKGNGCCGCQGEPVY